MRKRVLKEGGFYLVLLAAFTLMMHPDLLTQPAERLTRMQTRGSWAHPFVYTLLIYLVVLIFRGIVRIAARIFGRRAS